MNPRLQVALPAALTFVFGLGFGLVIGWVTWSGRQVVPMADAMPPAAMAGSARSAGNEAEQQGSDEQHDPQVLRQGLAAHEALIKEHPEDISLMRTVGNYHGMLGEHDQALAIYAKAEALARSKGETTLLVDILTDQGVALAEKGQYDEGFAKLDEAKATVPLDTRSRLTAAMILMSRIVPAPPPGWDRKQAVEKAEVLLREVLDIEPDESNATEMLGMITAIRGSMGRGNAPRPAGSAGMGDAGGASSGTTSTEPVGGVR